MFACQLNCSGLEDQEQITENQKLNGETTISYSTWNPNEEAQHHRKCQSRPCTNQRQINPQMQFWLRVWTLQALSWPERVTSTPP